MIESKITCRDIDGNKYKVNKNKFIFRPSVYGIVIQKNHILLSKQFKDGYDFPGGGIEKYETIEQALKREVWEETGLKIKVGKLVDCQSSFYKSRLHKEYWNGILLYYICKKVGGKLSKDNFDEYEIKYADMPEWVDLKKINRIKFYNSVDSLALIKKALIINKQS